MNKEITVINYLGEKMGSGGIESFVSNVSEGMKEDNILFIVVANVRGNSIYEETIKRNGGQAVYLFDRKVGYINKLCGFLRYIDNNPNCIVYFHASNPGLLFYSFLVKMIGNGKIVYHVHSTKNPLDSVTKVLRHEIIRLIFGGIPRINAACSEKAGKDIYRNRQYRIVHNGVNLERFRFNELYRNETRRYYGWENKFVVLQIGRLAAQKNQFYTLDIFKRFSKQHPDIVLAFIGDGEYRKGLEETAKREGIIHKVFFIPASQDVERFYFAADLFLFPSVWEGLGIVAIESQAAGLPTICSEAIVNEVKWLEKMEEVRTNKIDRTVLSEIGIKCCKEAGFSISNAHNELVSIYKNINELT